MTRITLAGLAAGVALAAAAPARADVVLHFTQDRVGTPFVGGTLTLTDAAFADGFNLDFRVTGPVVTGTGFDSIRAVTASLIFGPYNVTLDRDTFFTAFTSGLGRLSSGPGALPTGFLNLGADGYATLVDFTGDRFSGVFGSRAGTTSFSGTVTVPEPASAALFGTGLLGLGLIRRRRRAGRS